MSIKAVIFDLDGVLWDSSSIHEKAFRESLEELGVSLPSSFYNFVAGMKTETAINSLLAKYAPKLQYNRDAISQAIKMKRDIASRMLEKKENCYRIIDRDMMDVIHKLKNKSIKVTVATGASRKTMDIFTAHTADIVQFDLMLCSEDVREGKPMPEIFESSVRRLNLKPFECIIVEDSESGILASLNAGIRVLPYRFKKEIKNPLIVKSCEKPSEVLEAIMLLKDT